MQARGGHRGGLGAVGRVGHQPGHRVGAGALQAFRPGAAAAFGHGLGEGGEQHRQPQPGGDGDGEGRALATGDVFDADDGDHDRDNFGDEDHRIAHQGDGVEFRKGIDRCPAQNAGVEQRNHFSIRSCHCLDL